MPYFQIAWAGASYTMKRYGSYDLWSRSSPYSYVCHGDDDVCDLLTSSGFSGNWSWRPGILYRPISPSRYCMHKPCIGCVILVQTHLQFWRTPSSAVLELLPRAVTQVRQRDTNIGQQGWCISFILFHPRSHEISSAECWLDRTWRNKRSIQPNMHVYYWRSLPLLHGLP